MQYNFKGSYDSTQNYVVKDVVSYQPTVNDPVKYYMCLSPIYNTNPQLPTVGADNMYWGIINTLSNFPQTVDSFIYRVDIQGNDKVDIARINELTLKTGLTSSEQDELNGLIAKHRNKLFLADDLNAIQDSLSNLQMFFKDKVEAYISSSILNIQIARDNALSALDTKKASLDLYLDSTTAGALRTDIGVMSNLKTTDKSSLVNAVNSAMDSSVGVATDFSMRYGLGTAFNDGKGLVISDVNNATTAGNYYINPNTLNAPTTNAGSLWSSGGTSYLSQTFLDFTTGDMYFRVKYSGVWQAWNKTASQGWIKSFGFAGNGANAPSNLNAITATGVYIVGNTETNRPTDFGTLFHMQRNSDATQLFISTGSFWDITFI
jgi:hypothetical protein